jgi:hypothetical protein
VYARLILLLQVIPGNETKVAEMLNSLAMQGARVVAGRTDNLHVSGHAYQVKLQPTTQSILYAALHTNLYKCCPTTQLLPLYSHIDLMPSC